MQLEERTHAEHEVPDGWIAMTCRNHPTKRWMRKDPAAMTGQISQNPQLRYDGDLADGSSAHPFGRMVLDGLAEHERAHREAYWAESGWSFECECPYTDLVYRPRA